MAKRASTPRTRGKNTTITANRKLTGAARREARAATSGRRGAGGTSPVPRNRR